MGGVAAFYWQIRRRGLPLAQAFDSAAPGLAIAYAFGRMGCFLVGDDYGLPSNGPFAMVFPREAAIPSTAGYLRSVGADVPAQLPDAALLAVHPTQLYEIAAALLIFAVLWKVSRPSLAPGRLFGLYLALYGAEDREDLWAGSVRDGGQMRMSRSPWGRMIEVLRSSL